jgi:hypothetical protein
MAAIYFGSTNNNRDLLIDFISECYILLQGTEENREKLRDVTFIDIGVPWNVNVNRAMQDSMDSVSVCSRICIFHLFCSRGNKGHEWIDC